MTGPFAIVTDARRREVAITVFDGCDADGIPRVAAETVLVPRAESEAHLAGIRHIEVGSLSAADLARVGARATAAGRILAGGEPLYLRSPDVTLPGAPEAGGIVTLRDAVPADLGAIMEIERRSFPTDAWSAETMAAELAGPHGRVSRRRAGRRHHRVRRRARPSPAARMPTSRPSPSTPPTAVRAADGCCCAPSSTRQASAGPARCSSRSGRTTRAAEGLYLSEGFEEIGKAAPLLSAG